MITMPNDDHIGSRTPLDHMMQIFSSLHQHTPIGLGTIIHIFTEKSKMGEVFSAHQRYAIPTCKKQG
jgi:hypothetical protein